MTTNSVLNSKHSIWALSGLLRPYRWQILLTLVLGIASAILEGVGLGLLVPVLQGLTDSGNVTSGNPVIDVLSRPFSDIPAENRLQVLMVVLLVVTALKTGVIFGHTALGEWLRINLMRNLRCQIFDQYLRVGYQFLAGQRAGDLWNDLTNETNRAGQLLTRFIQQIGILFFAVVCAGLLLAISWLLTLLAVVMLGGLSFVLRFVVRRSRLAGEQISKSYSHHASVGLEALSAMRVIRLFGREDFERDRFEGAVRDANRADLHTSLIGALVAPLSELFTMGMFALIFLLAARVFIQQTDAVLPLLLTF
ncbi:MAG: ABC transporter transmembrane domain-containing protein, partial [bacterium]|nr:ABC transporter transmembrane domain-containing protein [bacterium]